MPRKGPVPAKEALKAVVDSSPPCQVGTVAANRGHVDILSALAGARAALHVARLAATQCTTESKAWSAIASAAHAGGHGDCDDAEAALETARARATD